MADYHVWPSSIDIQVTLFNIVGSHESMSRAAFLVIRQLIGSKLFHVSVHTPWLYSGFKYSSSLGICNLKYCLFCVRNDVCSAHPSI